MPGATKPPLPSLHSISLHEIMCTWTHVWYFCLACITFNCQLLKGYRWYCDLSRKKVPVCFFSFFFSKPTIRGEPFVKRRKSVHLKLTWLLKCLMGHKTLAFSCQLFTYRLVCCQVLHPAWSRDNHDRGVSDSVLGLNVCFVNKNPN